MLKVHRKTDSKMSRGVKTKNGRITVLSNCDVFDSKKSKFIKEQEASGILSCLGLKTLFRKVPLVGPIFF